MRNAPARRFYYYNVRPRYTPGSPAMVSHEIAEHVAVQEIEGYRAALSGIYGEAEKARAIELGLKGIAEAVHEDSRGKHWDVIDLCTGEKYERPVPSRHRRRKS